MGKYERLGLLQPLLIDISSSADVRWALQRICEVYCLKNAAYLALELPQYILPEPYFVATYSTAWVERYRSQKYVEIDPVLHEGAKSILPINWTDLHKLEPPISNFFKEAKSFGVGSNGLTIPIRGPYGELALFSVSSEQTDMVWEQNLHAHTQDYQLIAHHVHELVVNEMNLAHSISIPRREKEVIQWLAAGKTIEDVADILGLSANTVTQYARASRVRLNALNSTHAIVKALRMKLIKPYD